MKQFPELIPLCGAVRDSLVYLFCFMAFFCFSFVSPISFSTDFLGGRWHCGLNIWLIKGMMQGHLYDKYKFLKSRRTTKSFPCKVNIECKHYDRWLLVWLCYGKNSGGGRNGGWRMSVAWDVGEVGWGWRCGQAGGVGWGSDGEVPEEVRVEGRCRFKKPIKIRKQYQSLWLPSAHPNKSIFYNCRNHLTSSQHPSTFFLQKFR